MTAPPSRDGFGDGGFTLLPLTVLALLLASLSLLLVHEGMAEKSLVDLQSSRMRALELAEIGLARAEMEILSEVDADGDGLGTLTASFAGGMYEVTATEVDPARGRWVLVADGRHGMSSRRIEVGVERPTDSVWQWALFGKESVVLSGGSWTDAYDSRDGTYASQVVNADAVGTYAALGAGIGSNLELKVGGGAVRGDARVGPFGTTDFSGGVLLYGDTSPYPEDQVIPDPPYADFEAAYAANDNLSIDVSDPKVKYDHTALEMITGGIVLTLTGGTYIFNTLKMTGGGTLRITGPSRIYITNHFEISGGGIVNETGDPANCQIIAHPYDFPPGSRHDKLKVITSGGSSTALAVYAPAFHAECSGGGDVYGSFVANTVVFSGGSGFHYDKALGDIGAEGAAALERLYWLERTPPPGPSR